MLHNLAGATIQVANVVNYKRIAIKAYRYKEHAKKCTVVHLSLYLYILIDMFIISISSC